MDAPSEATDIRSRSPGVIRERLLDAAEAVFLETGYAEGSTNAVLERAGGSKATLFKYFPTKEALYCAMIERMATRTLAAPAGSIPDGDPRAFLIEFGTRTLAFLMEPLHIKTARLLVADATRFPGLSESFYRAGPAVILQAIETRLARWTREGKLGCKDPAADAQRFLDLLSSGAIMRAFYGFGPAPTRGSMAADAKAAADLFLDGRGAR